jgi:hypothetical protein
MIRKIISHILVFSFLLMVSGCFTAQNYSDPPEVLIKKEKGQNDVVYDNIDSLTLVNNKTINLSNYTSRFIKSYMDSSYKFVYFYKSTILDSIDIKKISYIHYTVSKPDNDKTLHYVAHSIFVPLAILGIVFLFAAPKIFRQ